MARYRTAFRGLVGMDWSSKSESADSALIAAYSKAKRVSEMEAESVMRSGSRKTIADLKKLLNKYSARGVSTPFEVSDDLQYLRTRAMTRKERQETRYAGKLYELVISGTDRDFEYDAAACMSAFEKYRFEVTQKVGDGSIDFFGIIRNFGHSTLAHTESNSLRIIGSAKKYSSGVPRSHAEQMTAVVQSVRERSTRLNGLVPHWFASYDGPMTVAIISKYGLQSGAIQYCKDHGYFFADAYEVAFGLARTLFRADGFSGSTEDFIKKIRTRAN